MNWRTKEWLTEHYVIKQLSLKQIAKIVNRSDVAIGIAAKKFGIPIRSISGQCGLEYQHITKEILIELYINQELSIVNVASRLNTTYAVVRSRLVYLNINRRERSATRVISLDHRVDRKPRKDWANKKWLTEQYVNAHKSIHDICDLVGWSYGKVRRTILENGIKLRDCSEAMLARKDEISAQWEDADFRTKMAEIRGRNSSVKVTKPQLKLYKILDGLGVEYYREHNDRPHDPECTIGGYKFDCRVKRPGRPDLIIEYNGSWWHDKPNGIYNDANKAAILAELPQHFELKYIWDKELKDTQKATLLIKYWLGLVELDRLNYKLSDLKVEKIDFDIAKGIISKYHYLPNMVRGGICHGAILDGQVIAVAVYSSLIRQNLAATLPCPVDNVLELSRLCVLPNARTKNLLSWFLPRSLKALPDEIYHIISYCDTTHNHTGAVYKAANFKLDREIKADYWYAASNGDAIHKKTVYNRAKKLGITEREYSEQNLLKKEFGYKKYRFSYTRSKLLKLANLDVGA